MSRILLLKESLLSAFHLFRERKVITMASASSFYLVLSIVPFFLLFMNVLAKLFGSYFNSKTMFLEMTKKILPTDLVFVIDKLEVASNSEVFNLHSFTLINLFVFTLACLSFINSIWNTLYLIHEDKSALAFRKHFKGILLLFVTIVLMALVMSINPVLYFILPFFKENSFVNLIWENWQSSRGVITFFRNIEYQSFFRSNFFYFVIFWIYFSFIYRWFLNFKLSLSNSLVSSGLFTSLLFIGKSLFWLYVANGKQLLMQSYGQYYVFIITLIWIYFVMCFYYFGACLSVQLMRRPIKFSNIIETSEGGELPPSEE